MANIPRANAGGPFNSGYFPQTQHPIDISGAFDAAIGGAENLVRSAFQRKQLDRENQRQDAALALEKQRYGDDQAYKAKDLELRTTTERHRALEAGITPAQTVTQPATAASAMTVHAPDLGPAPGASNALNPLASPPGEGSDPAAVPMQTSAGIRSAMVPVAAQPAQNVTLPESYDPTKAATYQRVMAPAQLRANTAEDIAGKNRAARLTQIETQAQAAADRQAAHDRATAKTASEKQARGLTANALETWRTKMADGVMQMHDGSLEAAEDFLKNDPVGQGYAKRGLTGEDMYAAAGRFRGVSNSEAVKQLGSSSPAKAVEKVATVRRLNNPNAKPSAAAAGAAAPAKAGMRPDGKTPKDTITAAEAKALKGLGRTQAEIDSNYVVKP